MAFSSLSRACHSALFALLLLFICSSAQAASSSTFIYSSEGANLTVSLTAVADTGDLFFRVAAPAQYDWVGLGIGGQMKGSLTFIAYTSQNLKDVTLSPRLGVANSEPQYNPSIKANKIGGLPNSIDLTDTGYMELSFACYNCTHWSNPPLDLTSATAPFMFAVGPIADQTSSRRSDKLDAPLRSHTLYSTFTMDMRQATVPTGNGVSIPDLGNSTSGASTNVKLIYVPHDYLSAFHAICMCMAFGLLLPFDAMVYRIFRWRRVHIWLSSIMLAVFVVGLVLGFYVSSQFVRSKHYNSPHQVIGILMLLIMLGQIFIGAYRHRALNLSKVLSDPASRAQIRNLKNPVSRSHRFIALTLFVLAVINGIIGFDFALASSYNRLWGPLIGAVAVVFVVVTGASYWRDANKKDDDMEKETARRMQEEYAAYAAGQNQPPTGGYAQNGNNMELGAYPHGEQEAGHHGSVPIPRPY